jgi:hypothetical protein
MKWKILSTDGGTAESYMQVPGGLIIRSEILGRPAMAYIPDPNAAFKPEATDDDSDTFRGKFVKMPIKGGGAAWVALDKIIAIRESGEVNLDGGHTLQTSMKPDDFFNLVRVR